MNPLALVAKTSGRFRGHPDRGFHCNAPTFCLSFCGGAGTVDAYLPERRVAALRELRRHR
ncbi:hypothetical protein FD535_07715 [Cutibacterium acnes]|nr:hypothetical protein FD524_06810 [Cutibacterium acnes]TLG55698.1 hypothetical protein FD535_07715 [Cutibacterium acnes]TMT19562.1 hypothetical protein DMX69_10090 [Cutibacterium acnes]TNH51978.1 hypothetical protein DMX82_07735 [Cutibacterium acnes]